MHKTVLILSLLFSLFHVEVFGQEESEQAYCPWRPGDYIYDYCIPEFKYADDPIVECYFAAYETQPYGDPIVAAYPLGPCAPYFSIEYFFHYPPTGGLIRIDSVEKICGPGDTLLPWSWQPFDHIDSVSMLNGAQCMDSLYVMIKIGMLSSGSNIYELDTMMHKIVFRCDSSPEVSILPSPLPDSICQGDTTEIWSTLGDDNRFSYSWLYSPTNSPYAFVEVDTNWSHPATAGGYYVLEVLEDGLCAPQRSDTVFLNVTGLDPVISPSGLYHINCADTSVQSFPSIYLNNPLQFLNHHFQWMWNGNPVGNGGISHGPVKLNGEYWLKVTEASSGCIGVSNTFKLALHGLPPANISLTGDTVFCTPTQNRPQLSTTHSNWIHDFYAIDSLGNEILLGSQAPPFEINISGTHSFYAVFTNPAGCQGYTDTIKARIRPYSDPDLNVELEQTVFCMGDTLALTHNYNSSFTYSYTFTGGNITHIPKGNLFSYNLSQPGIHTIEIQGLTPHGCQSTWTKNIYVSPEGCCDQSTTDLIFLDTLKPGSYSGNYLIAGDLYTSVNGNFQFHYATLKFVGKAVKHQNKQGGYSTGPSIYVGDSSTITFIASDLRAFCDTMWGGIKLGNHSNLEFEGNTMMDSYNGIIPDLSSFPNPPNPNHLFYMGGSGNVFKNNFTSMTLYQQKSNGILDAIYGSFLCDPSKMLFPFDSASNGELQRSKVGVRLMSFSSPKWYPSSQTNDTMLYVSNHQFGLKVINGTNVSGVQSFHLDSNTIASIHVKSSNNAVTFSNSDIVLPNTLASFSLQDQERFNILNIPARNYGVLSSASSLVLRNFEVESDQHGIIEDEFSNGNAGVYFSGTGNTLKAESSDFTGLDIGFEIDRSLGVDLDIDSCFIFGNIYGLRIIDSEIDEFEFRCNHISSAEFDLNTTTYGVYLDTESSLNSDVGGPYSSIQNTYPAGNGWPVDMRVSPGWPHTTTGIQGSPDVNLWTPWTNWYSWYHDGYGFNDDPGYRYWRFDNEFFGEDSIQANSAVHPAVIAEKGGFNATSSWCFSTNFIPFPNARIGRNIQFGDSIEFVRNSVVPYPNPATDVLSFQGLEEEASGNCLIKNSLGKRMLETLVESNTQIDVSNLPAGVYFLELRLSDGNMERFSVVIK